MLKVEIRSGKPRRVRKKYAQYMRTGAQGANTRQVNTGQVWGKLNIGLHSVLQNRNLPCAHNFRKGPALWTQL